MAYFKVEILGAQKLSQKIQNYLSIVPQVEAIALYRTAEQIMTLSKDRYVPVDTGLLRSTGYVKRPERHGSIMTVEMGFNTEYAVYVHEDLGAYHPIGQAKYLEAPVIYATQRRWLEYNIAEELRKRGFRP